MSQCTLVVDPCTGFTQTDDSLLAAGYLAFPIPLLCLTLDTSGSASVAKPISERLRSDESTQNTNSYC